MSRRGGQRALVLSLVLSLVLLVSSLLPATSAAQSYPKLTASDYALDLYQGAVLGGTRVIGLGGAYVSIAEGSEGIQFNPAAVANRTYFSNERIDWTWHLDFLLAKGLGTDALDFDNNGRATSSESMLLTGGVLFQYGDFGIGLTVGWQLPELGAIGGRTYQATLLDARLSVGYALLGQQLILAGGLRVGQLSLALADNANDKLFDVNVAGFEAGVLWRPRALPLRIGAALSLPFDRNQTKACGDGCPQGFFLPSEVTLPWEVRVGISYRLGEGRYNPTPDYVSRDRRSELYQAAMRRRAASQPATSQPATSRPVTSRPATSRPVTSRPGPPPPPLAKPRKPDLARDYRGGRYLLLSLEAVLIGPSKNAIGPDGFALQEREPVGRNVNVSLRFGIESELWRRRLRLRAGTYWEPSRYENRAGRLHGTASALLRLFDFSLWGERSLAWAPGIDVSSRYLNISFLISFWH